MSFTGHLNQVDSVVHEEEIHEMEVPLQIHHALHSSRTHQDLLGGGQVPLRVG